MLCSPVPGTVCHEITRSVLKNSPMKAGTIELNHLPKVTVSKRGNQGSSPNSPAPQSVGLVTMLQRQ